MKTGELKINSKVRNLVFFQCELHKKNLFTNKSYIEKFFTYVDDKHGINWLSSYVEDTGNYITEQYSDELLESLKAKLIEKLSSYE